MLEQLSLPVNSSPLSCIVGSFITEKNLSHVNIGLPFNSKNITFNWPHPYFSVFHIIYSAIRKMLMYLTPSIILLKTGVNLSAQKTVSISYLA